MRAGTHIHSLIAVLLLTVCFSLATLLAPHFQRPAGDQSQTAVSLLLSDSRRLFAGLFFRKADVYFHSGFYPTVFDNQESFQTPHMAEDAGALAGKNRGEETGFMGEPLDFIEAFSRRFLPTSHTHLDEGGAPGSDLGESGGGEVREILPWLQIAAELDPNRVETYLVTAYWLRSRMGKVDEAQAFLREGLRANPYHPALLFELGRIYAENRKDPARARNIWELGVAKLEQRPGPRTDEDDFILFQLTLHLARLEEDQGNLPAAIQWLERVKTVSPNPAEIQKQIDEDRRKVGRSAVPRAEPPATLKHPTP